MKRKKKPPSKSSVEVEIKPISKPQTKNIIEKKVIGDFEQKAKNIYKCVKVPLKSVIRHQYEHKIILENVNKITKIYINTLQFIKLFYLYRYENFGEYQNIDINFVLSALKTVCLPNNIEQKDEIQKNYVIMREFYDKYYKNLTQYQDLNYDGLATVFQYLAVEILTTYENNVRLRYYEYVRKFVNSFFMKKQYVEFYKLNYSKTKRKELISNLCKRNKLIVNDILNISDKKYSSDTVYHNFIDLHKKILLPNKTFTKELIYDVDDNPMEYFTCMFKMSKLTEQMNEKIYNLFPQRTSIIPRHIKLDTTTIINILMECDKIYYKNNIKSKNQEIWEKFFKLHKREFKKKGYKFNFSIITDGVSCSILFIKEEYAGKYVNISKKKIRERYIHNITETEKENLKDKTIIAIDPNKSDLLYCVDGMDKESNHFRYTQDQRRKETKIKKYRNIREELSKTVMENNNTVKDLETELSKNNDKNSLNFTKYCDYLVLKNNVNFKLWEHYQNYIYRKLNLNVYLNTLRSEQNLIKNINEKFGSPKDTIICIGDWEQYMQMKFKEPTKGKGFRDLFRKYGYIVYLVDEHKTSCKCSICEGDNENFRERISPKPNKTNKSLVHGLLKCKSCKMLWNRDENSSNNIYLIARRTILGLERPEYLKRQ